MLIVGTGAVAAFLCRSLQSDFQVFGSESPRLQALQEQYSQHGSVSAVSSADEVEAHSLWVVAVKTWQNPEKIEALKNAPRPRAILVLQNGLDPEVSWRSFDCTVERGLSTYGVRSVGPGRIAGGEAGVLSLAEASTFRTVFEKAGLCVESVADMRASVWRKLAVNASLNVVATLHGLRNGEALRHPEGKQLMRSVCDEVAQLGRCLGVATDACEFWAHTQDVALKTSENICSTLADFRSGRPTEYDSINGRLLQIARSWGVKAPALKRLHEDFTSLTMRGTSECLVL